MSLLLPLGLFALAAWALPLLLHLARREQQQPTEFAALRWLGARHRPRQRLRFEEIPLLLVRLALLAALALLITQPVRDGGGPGRPVVALHPALSAERPGDLPDGSRVVWLAPGFPPVAEGPAPAPTALPAWSLLRELDASLPAGTALDVYVPAAFDGADGARPRLSRPVAWRVVRADGAVDDPAPAAPGTPTAALPARLELVGDPAQRRWLRAALSALAGDGDVSGGSEGDGRAAMREDASADGALADRVHAGTTALLTADVPWPLSRPGAVAWRDADGRVLARAARHGGGRVVQWQVPLQPETLPALLEADFPHRLQALLQPPRPAPTRVDAAAVAPLDGGPPPAPPPVPLEPWLLAAVLALFALERWLAGGPRRRTTA